MHACTHVHVHKHAPSSLCKADRGQESLGRSEWEARCVTGAGSASEGPERAAGGLPKMGPERSGPRRRKGRAGRRGRGRGRGAGALSRPSEAACPALRPPPPQPGAGRLGLEPHVVPSGQTGAPPDPPQEAWPGGLARRPGRLESRSGLTALQVLPGPAHARPRGCVRRRGAASESSRPRRSGLSTLDLGMSARDPGRKGSKNVCVPIPPTRPPRPQRGQSLHSREGIWRAPQLPSPDQDPEACGVMLKATNRVLSAPA